VGEKGGRDVGYRLRSSGPDARGTKLRGTAREGPPHPLGLLSGENDFYWLKIRSPLYRRKGVK